MLTSQIPSLTAVYNKVLHICLGEFSDMAKQEARHLGALSRLTSKNLESEVILETNYTLVKNLDIIFV